MLSAVLDGISDGVGVVDASGNFLLHNPAAKRMLGVDDVAGSGAWQGHYGRPLPLEAHMTLLFEKLGVTKRVQIVLLVSDAKQG